MASKTDLDKVLKAVQDNGNILAMILESVKRPIEGQSKHHTQLELSETVTKLEQRVEKLETSIVKINSLLSGFSSNIQHDSGETSQQATDVVLDNKVKPRLMSRNTIGEKIEIKDVEGDIFLAAETTSLAHFISKDFVMEYGVTLAFKEKFGDVPELIEQEKDVGEVAVLKQENHFVYYLISRPTFNVKSKDENVIKCLEAMREHCLKHKVKHIAIPKMSGVKDRLKWDVVSRLLDGVFKDTKITFFAYHAPAAKFQYEEVDSNIVSASESTSLALCWDDYEKDKGIISLAEECFGGFNKLKDQDKDEGDVAILTQDDKRFFYFLMTDLEYAKKPNYEGFRQCLEATRKHCLEHNVAHLAMRMVDCRESGCDRNKVIEFIKNTFRKTDMKITVHRVPTFQYEEIHGCLFSADVTTALAHCISENFAMGAGIAYDFKKKFGGVGELLAQNKRVGQAAVLYREKGYIYYLITKREYNHKPTYNSLEASLLDMKKHCLANNVKHVAMPMIGCGLERLDWGNVSNMIKEVFCDTDMKITVYV